MFGEVRNTSDPLLKNFKIASLPTLIVITDSSTYSGVVYEGEFKKDKIVRFLNEYSHKKEEVRAQVIFDINQACQDLSHCLILASPHVARAKSSLEHI